MQEIDKRLAALNITLPLPIKPAGNYVGWVKTGAIIFVSGQVPIAEGKFPFIGKIGAEISVEHAREAARLCAINIVAQLHQASDGRLDHIRILKLTGFVNAVADFTDQPKVINGASDFLVELFGEKGKHSRSAVGAASLPSNVPVEIEAIAEII